MEHAARHVLDPVGPDEHTVLGDLLNDEEGGEEVEVVLALVVAVHEVEQPGLGLGLGPAVALLDSDAHLGEGVDEDEVVPRFEGLFECHLRALLDVVPEEQYVQLSEGGEPLAVAVEVDRVHLARHEEDTLARRGDLADHVQADGGLTETGSADHDDVGGGHETPVVREEGVQVLVLRGNGDGQAGVEGEVAHLDGHDVEVGDGLGFGSVVATPLGGELLIEQLLRDETEDLGGPVTHLAAGGWVEEAHLSDVLHNLFFLVTG